jgi:hypothetical protein
MVSCEYGHFWADAKRGKIFQLSPGAKEMNEVSKPTESVNDGLEKWFKENLPFKILQYYPSYNIDNNYKGIGLTMMWDDRFKRLFVTKMDYIPISNNLLFFGNEIYRTSGYEAVIAEYEADGYTYEGINGSNLEFHKPEEDCEGCDTILVTYQLVGEEPVTVEVVQNEDGNYLVNGFEVAKQDDEWNITKSCKVEFCIITYTIGETEYTLQLPQVGFYNDLPIYSIDNSINVYFESSEWIFDNDGLIATSNNFETWSSDDMSDISTYLEYLENECIVLVVDGEKYNVQKSGSLNSKNFYYFESSDVSIQVRYSGANWLSRINGSGSEYALFETFDIPISTDWFFQSGIEYEDLYTEDCNCDNLQATLPLYTPCPFGTYTIEKGSIFEAFEVVPAICQTEDTELVPLQRADFKDTEYFKPCSWTVAYSPVLRSWISYYSFVPNYYVAYNGYFQTGINDRFDADEFGLWSHFPYLSSNQVFYGKLYPFIIEYPINTKLTASRLDAIEYWLDIRKYYDKYDFTDVVANGFNKAVVYNSSQNTGQLELVRQQDDDMRQLLQYPTYNTDSIEVLQTELNHKWSFNYLYNTIKNERAGIPIWKEDCPQIYKQLDHRLLDYTAGYKDYLRGDYFLVRLIQDRESRFKLLYRFSTEERDFYNQ